MNRPPIEEIKARLEAATPGPWRVFENDTDHGCYHIYQCQEAESVLELRERKALVNANGVLIANAPQYLTDCLAYIEHLESQLTTTKEGKE